MTKYKIIDSQFKIEAHPIEPLTIEYVFDKAEYKGKEFYIRSKRHKHNKNVSSKAYSFALGTKKWNTSWIELLES